LGGVKGRHVTDLKQSVDELKRRRHGNYVGDGAHRLN